LKEKIIKIISNFLPVLVLALLLLLSPCKVKNFIQAELGVAQTEFATKGKTTISHSTCITIERTISIESKTNYNISCSSGFVANHFNLNFCKTGLFIKSLQLYKEGRNLIYTVPLYILYQKLKGYL